jgi:hypothetical protein
VLPDGPDLDASQAHRRQLRGDADRLVQIPGLDQQEASELLFRLGERAVDGGQLAVADRRVTAVSTGSSASDAM